MATISAAEAGGRFDEILERVTRGEEIVVTRDDQPIARSEVAKPVIDADGPGLAWTEIARLAERLSLTVYDATYLELARRKGLALASRCGPE